MKRRKFLKVAGLAVPGLLVASNSNGSLKEKIIKPRFLLEDNKEYAWGMETKFGNKRFYVRTVKGENKVVFEIDGMGYFTKEDFNIFCHTIGSMKCKV